MRPIPEMLTHIQSLASNSQHKDVFRICYELGLHIQQLQASNKTDALISETQTVIDREHARIRMAALIKLKAAPGQENHTLVRDFMLANKWLKHGQEPETHWPIAHVPATKEGMVELCQNLASFEMLMREQHHEHHQ